ncbi:MAG: long-chain fatty acid--CoA ligase [Pseudomonadota bacterium]|nr:long-chain fatty acid--CoA ligase [Pseudomonadota bacterium]
MTPPPHFDWIASHAGRYARKLAIVDLQRDRRLTYAAFDDRIARLARYLRDEAAVGVGDRVAVLAMNSSDVFEIQFACARIGAIFVPLNWRLAVPELAPIMADAEPTMLFTDAGRIGATLASLAGLGLATAVVEMGGGFDSPYERAIAASVRLDRSEPRNHDEIQTILYTSGTTGLPKGVLHSFGTTFWSIVNLSIPCAIDPDSVSLVTMPLFHVSGLNLYSNPVFHAGGTVLLMQGFEVGAALNAIDDPALGVTHFFGVPAVWQFMAAHPAFAETDFSRLIVAGVGGAPTPLPMLGLWARKGVQLLNGFGMTEAPVVTTLFAEDARIKTGSVGQPFLHMEVGVFDEHHRPAARGDVGELRVRGPGVSPGYWRKPELNEASFVDGWLRSGDLAYIDADGFTFVVDRAKDMFISGGENVYPAEVERVLLELPGVAEAAVVGMPDKRWGETGAAVVVPMPGMALTEAAVVAHCCERLAHYKVPGRVLFVADLPRNATGKVHKPSLRARIGEGAL